MSVVDVTIISSLYGESHRTFVEEWSQSVKKLRPFPSGITLVGCDAPRLVLGGFVAPPCDWKHPQAYYLQQALDRVETEWIWIHDIDDVARPDALEGIDLVPADVWQLGYERSDGEIYKPPQRQADEILNSDRNEFVAGSCIRTAAIRKVGGFPDCALQDWALWRRLALAGCTFEASGRVHFDYRRHPAARGEVELTLEHREADVREMLDLEAQVAYAG